MISIQYSKDSKKVIEIWGDRTDFDSLRILSLDITNEENSTIQQRGIAEFNVFHAFINGIRKATYGQRFVRGVSEISGYEHEEVGFELSFFQLIYTWSCLKINASLNSQEKLLDAFLLMIHHFIVKIIMDNDYINDQDQLLKIIDSLPMRGNKHPEIFLNRGEKFFLEEKDTKKAFNLVAELLKDSSPSSVTYARIVKNLALSEDQL
jgi:hypothetical protein